MKYKTVFKLLIFASIFYVFGCGIKGRPLPPSNNIVNVNQVQSVEDTKTDTTTPTKDPKNKSRKTKK